jgi:ATP-dependent DNA ligase
LKNRQKRFVIDGEAVILGVDGISDFDALHSGRHNEEVQLCAFDTSRKTANAPLNAEVQSRAATRSPARWHLHRAL